MQQTTKPMWSSPVLHITQAKKREFVKDILDKLQENYINQTVISSNKRLLEQQLLQSLNTRHETKEALAKDLTSVLQRIIKDKHLAVRLASNANVSEKNEARLKWMDDVRYGIESFKLENGIGYLNLTHAVWPRDFAWAKRSHDPLKRYVSEAFRHLNDAKALIIDLRNHEGGSPEMVAAMLSFFLPADMLLNEFHFRDPKGTMYETIKSWEPCFTLSPASLEKPVNGITVEKFKTIDEEALFGLKSNLKNVPIAVLTSSKTFSAGEEFAYNLKQLGRAIIVGETTAGGANPWSPVSLPYGLEFCIPNCEAVNPISKTNWEKKGVEPDVKVSGEMALTEATARLTAQIK
jgi:C-terminal processing protease CtpA/Prc